MIKKNSTVDFQDDVMASGMSLLVGKLLKWCTTLHGILFAIVVGRSRCGINKGMMLKVCLFQVTYLISLEKRAWLDIHQDMVQHH